MSTLQLALVQFTIGLLVSAWGYCDYRRVTTDPARTDAFTKIEQLMFPLVLPEVLAVANRASNVLVILVGLAICGSALL